MQKASLRKRFAKGKALYVMLIPCMIYTFIFSYYPLSGWIMAFENFRPAKGYWGSKFVGLDQFRFLFGDFEFWRAFRNTVVMSLMNLVFGFVFAIVFALLLNEIRSSAFKRVTQTVSYLPHFLSWVIVASIMINVLGQKGLVNGFLTTFFGTRPIAFLGKPEYFRPVIFITDVWKTAGWSAIIYMASISGIDMEQYEAAEIDGASRLQRIWYITLPGIKTTIMVLFMSAMLTFMPLAEPLE